MILYSKHIYLPNQIKKEGYLHIEEGKIIGIYDTYEGDFVDYSDYYLIPGFIDQHIHGWATGRYYPGNTTDNLKKMQETLPYAGVTSFLPTTGAWTDDELKQVIKDTTEHMKQQTSEMGSEIVGIHMEGPFVNAKRSGMMNVDGFKSPSIPLMREYLESSTIENAIRLMTVAPELPGGKEFVEYCHNQGIQLSVGHSDATFDEITDLKEYGLGGVTHMFSGMRGFHHRELGVVGAALHYDDLYCEFAKQTGWTVKKEAFAIVYKLKGADKIIMTTDNTGLSQTEEERYHYIRKQRFIPDGDFIIIESDDGTRERINRTEYENVKDIELSYIKSIQNLIRNVRPSVHEIIKMTAENPAKYVGIYDRKGSLEMGKDADILVVDKGFNLIDTYCRGVKF